MLRRFFKRLNRIADKIYQILFLLIFLFGSYALYDTYLVYEGAAGSSIHQYKPEIDHPEELKKLSEDAVAWLTVDDTAIDYPVMQGDDNTEYLNKDPYGAYSIAGSLFLDSRNAPEFTDAYSLIYGHHMDGGTMFGALDRYLEEEYFDSHRSGTLLTAEGTVYKIHIFAVLEASGTNELVFAPVDVPAEETWQYLKEHATYMRERGDGNLIALSTCKYPATAERIIVFGTLEKTESQGQSLEERNIEQ